jgi:prephenate dehydratase
MDLSKAKTIAFQGAFGAYSDLCCRTVLPGLRTIPCASFEDAFAAVADKTADLAMIPVDNTIAGRVADVHHLMPRGNLFIIAEHFQPIRHALLAPKGVKKEALKHVHSHIHAIPQCKKTIQRLKLTAHVHADTAGAAELIARLAREGGDQTHAAIASELAAEIYGLDIVERDVQDEHHNTTRFLVLGPEPDMPDPNAPTITSLIFGVRNIPAALYKCLGGFATNGLSLSKLESYVDPNFQAAQFFCDVDGHPESDAFKLALEELGFYATDVKFLGAYAAHPFRMNGRTQSIN